ncbi:MAG: DUF1328 domain-containing protein [Anaerolineae bacterium]
MLKWAIAFLVLAVVAAILGFVGIVSIAVDIFRILFWVFAALFVLSLVVGLVTGRSRGTRA